MTTHPDNSLIADTLQKNLEMPVDTWVQEGRQPLMPFVTSLQAAISKAAPCCAEKHARARAHRRLP